MLLKLIKNRAGNWSSKQIYNPIIEFITNPKFKAAVPVFATVAYLITTTAAFAQANYQDDQSDHETNQVGELTKEIVAKELELQQLNAHFRLESTRQPNWRPWRQFVYSETNAICTESGLIARMALSYPFMKTPATIYKLSTKTSAITKKKVTTVKTSLAKAARPNSKFVEAGAATQMIGQFIGMAGDTFELSSNLIGMVKAKRRGFDAKTYTKKFKAVTRELDELLAKREQAIETSSTDQGAHLQLVRAEGAVLHDVRDLSLLQYAQYHSGAKKLMFFQNGAYVLNIAKNAAGATGNILNLESTHLSQPKLAGGASLLTTVAGVIIVATPVFGRVSGNLAGLVDRRIVSKNFVNIQAHEAEEFAQHRRHLATLLASESSSTSEEASDAKARSDIYEAEEKLLIAQKGNLERERKLAKSTTFENVVFGTVVGSSRITQGILGMIGGWHYYNKPWINARFTAVGATAYSAGSAFNILETARVRATSELSSRDLRRKNLLPSQIVQNRIDTLEKMQNSLAMNSIASSNRKTQANLGIDR